MPTPERLVSPIMRESPLQQPLHAVSAGSLMLQHGGSWDTEADIDLAIVLRHQGRGSEAKAVL